MREVTESGFDREVLEADVPVLLKFTAPWCGSCKQIAPMIDGIAKKKNKVKFLEVDVDKSPNVGVMHNVSSLPAFVLYRDGRVVDELHGMITPHQLECMLDEAL